MTIKAKNIIPPFNGPQLESISKVLGDTDNGLTGSEIEYKLAQCQIPDTSPKITKWRRLYNAFVEFQNENQVGNHVIIFINEVLNPASYTGKPELFQSRKIELNAILSLSGFCIGDNGKIKKVIKTSTLDEALERSNRLKEHLRRRNAHSYIFDFCNSEIIVNNNFHAVLESMKSITSRIRKLSELTSDGQDLVTAAFSLGKTNTPILAINSLETETLRGEQKGFVNLLVGLYGMIRNPTAHEPKIEWQMNEDDVLDILSTISFIHRKLDKTYKYIKK